MEKKGTIKLWARRLSLIWIWIVGFVLMTIGQLLGQLLYLIPGVEDASGAVQIGLMYASFIGIWAVFMLHILIWKKNRPIFKALWTRSPGNNIMMFLLGFLLFGMLLNCICILAAFLNKDIFLRFECFEPLPLLGILICVFIQSSAEELVCRGFIYQRLRKNYKNPWVAIIGNSVLFGLLHLANPGVSVLAIINIVAVGILYSLMVYYGNSIWCAMAAHTAWNYTQNIIFGLPNSGAVSPYSIFMLDASTARDSFAYNVAFGVEGTILADIILVIACIGLYRWYRNHPQPEYRIWEDDGKKAAAELPSETGIQKAEDIPEEGQTASASEELK